MKRTKACLLAIWAAVAAMTLAACDHDDSYRYDFSYVVPTALVTVKPDTAGGPCLLQLDDSTALQPVNMPQSPFGDKEVRALASFEYVNRPLHGQLPGVRIYWIDSILTKPTAPDLGADNDSAYGDEPVEIVNSWESGTPRLFYVLNNIPLRDRPSQTVAPALPEVLSAEVHAEHLQLFVVEEAPTDSVMRLAFSSVGGHPWMYALLMLSGLSFIAIVVLMFLIIHSLRRSIREERTLEQRNVWLLRTIGALTILAELFQDIVNWRMAHRAAELLSGSDYAVDTMFHVSYTNIIMGILILFAAEVFAIGRNLSEEQRLTI